MTPDESPVSQPPVLPPTPVQPGQPTTAPKKHGKKKLILIIALVFVLILGLSAAGAYWWNSKQKADKAKTVVQPVKAGPKQFCYVRLSHLVCVDQQATNPTRYDLPMIDNKEISGLLASPDQSRFVAKVSTPDGIDSYWLLDANLKNPKQILNNTGDVIYQPAWSHDGKSLVMEINPSGVNNNDARHIYRYTVATGSVAKLTNARLNRNPYELADGKIMYLSFSGTSSADGTTWVPYVMDADGKNPQAYATSLVNKNLLSMSYDLPSDTVYLNSSEGAGGKITYFPASKVNESKFVQARVNSSSDQVNVFATDMIVLDKNLQGDVIDLSTGKVMSTIKGYGNPVGIISVPNLVKSATQAEAPHERIFGLSAAPTDFQAFITKEFDAIPACPNAEAEVQFRIEGVVRDSFAKVNYGQCESGSVVFFAKKGDTWVKVANTQAALPCTLVNQYKFPKELITNCIDAKGTPIANPNT